MRKKYFNKRARRRTRFIIRRNSATNSRFSKRMGGMTGISVVVENRNVKTSAIASHQKEIL